MDKLSTRVSKIQADNQIRFQDIETNISSGNISSVENQLSSKPKTDEQKVLPGSSQPQDLGTISYKIQRQTKLHNKFNLLILQLQL